MGSINLKIKLKVNKSDEISMLDAKLNNKNFDIFIIFFESLLKNLDIYLFHLRNIPHLNFLNDVSPNLQRLISSIQFLQLESNLIFF